MARRVTDVEILAQSQGNSRVEEVEALAKTQKARRMMERLCPGGQEVGES